MAKMTISGLQSHTASYVAAAKQAGAWTATTGNFAGLLDKIGKTVTIDGLFNDKLPELEGTELPLGKTIEEYFLDLVLPEAMSGNNSTEGAKDIVPSLPSVESVVYSYSLGREKIKTTEPFDNVERAFNSVEDSANCISKISERLQNSFDVTRYFEKKQLLGNAIDKAVTANGTGNVTYVQLAKPVDASTGEAFITKIKDLAEDASFVHAGNCLAGKDCVIGATPSLTLFVKKGTMSQLEVKTYAGAFNKEDLAMNVKIKVVDDFGTMTNSKQCYALLVDERGIKLHNGYNVTRTSPNADGDFLNIVRHFEDTAFISKYVYMVAIGTQA